jgi:hypothetical protein
MNMEDIRLAVPAIQVNGLDVVEVHLPLRKKIKRSHGDSKSHQRALRKHDLKNCGCDRRKLSGGRVILHILYDLANDQSTQQECQEIASIMDQPATLPQVSAFKLRFRLSPLQHRAQNTNPPVASSATHYDRKIHTVIPIVTPAKGAFRVAFPSSYYDREACFNFYRHNWKQVAEEDNDEALCGNWSVGDENDAMSKYSSEILAISIQSVEYDFKGRPRGMTLYHDHVIEEWAPHQLTPLKRNTLLHPSSAFNVKKVQTRRAYRNTYRHPLSSCFQEIASPPEEAFNGVTGGPRREWLHEARPGFFKC